MDNRIIAQRLREYANYLDSQEMSVHRVRAYRRAAETVLGLEQPLAEIYTTQGARDSRPCPASARTCRLPSKACCATATSAP